MNEGSRLGLFGGTFDPVHLGHLVLAESLAETCRLERVAFVPAARPPHKQERPITPFADRLRMVELAIAGNPRFVARDLEARREGPSYTLDTVRALRAEGHEVVLLVGADTLPELPGWRMFEELLAAVELAVAARPGHDPHAHALPAALQQRLLDAIHETPWIEVASRQIRARVAEGKSIRYLVPDAVRDYITARGLYGAIRPG